MPWSSTEHITIKTRSQIYAAVIELLKLLRRAITDGKFNARLTPQLRNRLARAAMLCPGFTPLMKDNIVALAGISEQEACQAYNQPRGAHLWLHQYGIGVKLGVPLDVLEVSFFLLLIFPLSPHIPAPLTYPHFSHHITKPPDEMLTEASLVTVLHRRNPRRDHPRGR